MQAISGLWRRAKLSTIDFFHDGSGLAATEFAVIAPLMLVMFFGVVEFSSGIAVNRKVTLIARTLSDLTSQANVPIDDNYLTNVFTASISIVTPYPATPVKATISEIYIDSSKNATIQWSRAAMIANGATQAALATSARNPGDTITTLPPDIVVAQTYVILSEASYLYTPTVGYVMGAAGVTLSDLAYTRPRQSACISYNGVPSTKCPTP